MRQLSPFLYIKRNMKSILITTIGVLIGVVGVYFLSIITDTTNKGIDISSVNIFKESTMIIYKDECLPKKVVDQLKESENTEYLIPIRSLPGVVRYHMGLSSSSSFIYNLYYEDIESFLELMNLKIVKGNIPSENSKEILVSDRFAKQNNINIGDILNKKNINIRINGDYTVSGVYSGDINLAITNNANINDLTREDAYYYNIIYRSKDESYLDASDLVEKGKSYVNDYNSVKIEVDNSMKALKLFSDNLNIFMIIILCITLGNLNSIVLKKRANEVSILEAIGYKRRTIMFKLWKENFIAAILGYILGIIFTIMVIFVMNVLIFEDQGAEFLLFSGKGMINAIVIPIFISIYTLIPALKLKSKL